MTEAWREGKVRPDMRTRRSGRTAPPVAPGGCMALGIHTRERNAAHHRAQGSKHER